MLWPLQNLGEDTPGTSTTLTYGHVLIAFSFIIFDVILSLILGLKIAKSLIIGAVRCVVQLWLLGFVLESVFKTRNMFAIAGLSCLFNLLGAWEVVFNKSKKRYEGMFIHAFFSLILPCLPIAAIGSKFALAQSPFWEPTVYIPAVGMVLGNATSSLTVGFAYIISHVTENKDKIETLLAHGATRFEACQTLAVEGLRLAILPVINMMSVIGMISIPGMMTGSIMSGKPVDQATKMQSILMFIITAAATLSSVLGVLGCLRVLVDDKHRLRPDRTSSSRASLFSIIFKMIYSGKA